MQTFLIAAAILCGLATIAADWQRRRPVFYLLKPLTTLLIMALAWTALAAVPDYRFWIVLALVFCLVGDIALMSNQRMAFVAGLGSFLLGHLLFIAAFVQRGPLALASLDVLIWFAAVVFLLAALGYLRWLLPRTGRLRPAVVLYASVLAAVVLSALARAGHDETFGAQLVLFAALLFAVSDATLGYRRFVRAPVWGQALTLCTYYSAIGLFAWAY